MSAGAGARAGRRAVFVDRDGTIIREREYLSDPAGVELVPGAAESLRAFAAAGYGVVIVTNQSGIARGYYDEAAYAAVAAELEALLEGAGVALLGSYHCPHHPDITGPCDCRKPGTGLFRQAAREHNLDLARSIYIGDRVRDVAPAAELGGQGILVRTGYGREEASGAPADVAVVDDLMGAVAAAGIDPPGR